MNALFQRQIAIILAVASMSLGVSADVLGESFVVPCPKWSVGDSWETRSVIESINREGPSAIDQVVTVTSLVKSREGNRIVVSEKRATQAEWVDKRVHRGGPPPPHVMSTELLYEVVGKDVFLRQQKGDMISMAFDPPVPFCGLMPETVTYRVKGTVAGNGNDFEGGVTFRMLGKETVVVPAGSFEVTVFESRQEMKVDPSSPAPAPRGAPVIKSYVADGVGVVKTAIMSTVPRPIVQHQPDAGTAAAMQQGLAKLAKGMVPSLPKLRQPPAASGSQEFEEVEVENVTELIAYREAK